MKPTLLVSILFLFGITGCMTPDDNLKYSPDGAQITLLDNHLRFSEDKEFYDLAHADKISVIDIAAGTVNRLKFPEGFYVDQTVCIDGKIFAIAVPLNILNSLVLPVKEAAHKDQKNPGFDLNTRVLLTVRNLINKEPKDFESLEEFKKVQAGLEEFKKDVSAFRN